MFDAVFSAPDCRLHGRSCLMLARRNDGERGRLGVIVAKKNIPLAVQRNRFKRITREVFRRSPIEGLDVIVLAKQNKKKLRSAALANELSDLLLRLGGEQRP